jgi:hypothetical protein
MRYKFMQGMVVVMLCLVGAKNSHSADQCFDAQRALPANKPLPDKLITGYCTCYEKYKKTDMPAMRCYNIMWDDFHKLSKGIK